MNNNDSIKELNDEHFPRPPLFYNSSPLIGSLQSGSRANHLYNRFSSNDQAGQRHPCANWGCGFND
jgi:hypothetical protein